MSKKDKEKKESKNKIITVRLRIDKMDFLKLKNRATFFFNGNISKFIRHAVNNYKAPKNHGIKKEA